MKVNNITLTGTLGKDPQERSSAGGLMVVFSLCHSYVKKNGEKNTSWFDVIVMNEYLCKDAMKFNKGDQVIVTGPVSVSTSQGKDGKQYTNVSILANSLGRLEREDKDTFKDASSSNLGLMDNIPF